jgi:hypothetical protein
MRWIVSGLAALAFSVPAFAQVAGVPEIDGTMALQAMALAGGIALLLKKKRRT